MITKKYGTALLFGAPGVGKGTQGKILGQIPGFFHFSTGDVFRSLDIGTDEGRLVRTYLAKGELVPDDLTMRIWRKVLEANITMATFKPREDLLILDGIPRSVRQAELLEESVVVAKVIHLVCHDQDAMVERIRRRAIRESRMDDANETVIRHRFEVYTEWTQPVLDYYPRDLVVEVDATGSPAQVLFGILEHVIPTQERLFRSNL